MQICLWFLVLNWLKISLPYVSNFVGGKEEIEIDCLGKNTPVSKCNNYNGHDSLVATSPETRTYLRVTGLFGRCNDLHSDFCSVQNSEGSLVFIFRALTD